MDTFSPSVVLAAFAEPLLDGRRVAVFGDATSSLADVLLERGARVVHLFDPDPARAAEAAGRNRSKQISVLPLDAADLAVRDGAFDVALIADLSSLGDRVRLLGRVRRALSVRGVAIVASPNPDAKMTLLPRAAAANSPVISYYDLFDAMSAEFPEVRMLGQTPFVGYAVVDFSPAEEPEVSLDSGLLPGGAEEPEWFVAVASMSPVEIEAFSVVQLPAARVIRASAGSDSRMASELRTARTQEARLSEEVAALKVAAEERATRAAPAREKSLERVQALEAELSKREAWISELEGRATAADARADDAQGKLDSLRTTQKQSASSDSVRTELEKRLADQATAQATEKARLEKRLADQDTEKARLEKRLADQDTEKARLEKRLADQDAEKRPLEKRVTDQGVEKERLDKRVAEHSTEKERLEKRLAEHIAEKEGLEKRLAQRELDIARLTAVPVGEGSDDVARLETVLKDRGERVRKLEADLREAERVGKELVRRLSSAQNRVPLGGVPAEPPKVATSPVLASENARLRADLEAAGWTIQELEGRLSPAISPAPVR